jgi:hypothetical protein
MPEAPGVSGHLDAEIEMTPRTPTPKPLPRWLGRAGAAPSGTGQGGDGHDAGVGGGGSAGQGAKRYPNRLPIAQVIAAVAFCAGLPHDSVLVSSRGASMKVLRRGTAARYGDQVAALTEQVTQALVIAVPALGAALWHGFAARRANRLLTESRGAPVKSGSRPPGRPPRSPAEYIAWCDASGLPAYPHGRPVWGTAS